MDVVLRMHFIKLQYSLAPFAFGRALTLIALTFTVGLLFGAIFANIWNWLATAPTPSAAVSPAGAGV
jgi:hypothetical protein